MLVLYVALGTLWHCILKANTREFFFLSDCTLKCRQHVGCQTHDFVIALQFNTYMYKLSYINQHMNFFYWEFSLSCQLS